MDVVEEDKLLQVHILSIFRQLGLTTFVVARTCNLIFIVLDVLKPLGDKKIIESELEGFGIRLNKKPPQILVRKKARLSVSKGKLKTYFV
jgi:ribosome-interacting GTPase 1